MQKKMVTVVVLLLMTGCHGHHVSDSSSRSRGGDPYGLPPELPRESAVSKHSVSAAREVNLSRQSVVRQQGAESTPVVEGAAQPELSAEGATSTYPMNPAVKRLLQQAAALRRQGELDRAVATAERALSIDGQDARVYLELARIRKAQGRSDWARQLLFKGKALPADRGTHWQIRLELENL